MTHLNLDDFRVMAHNHGGKVGATIATLCDEVERLRKPQPVCGDLDAIRRMAESGVPIPPWLVQALCDRVERATAERQGLTDDVAVLDEELYDLRLALLKLRWKEQTHDRAPAR